MTDQLQPSPQMQAEQFIRANLDTLGLHDLQAHEAIALHALAGLNDYTIRPGLSVGAMLSARKLVRDVNRQLLHLRTLIHAQQAVMALSHAVAAGQVSLMAPAMAKPGKHSRVIRSLPSADNAASGPSTISSNAQLGRDSEAAEGGEAKEAPPARPQSGEASLQAKR